jgi:hypothetical protein
MFSLTMTPLKCFCAFCALALRNILTMGKLNNSNVGETKTKDVAKVLRIALYFQYYI